jgi:L-seryl-tRNA(Ser) seleniumtransferase
MDVSDQKPRSSVRYLPQIQKLLESEALMPLLADRPRDAVVTALRGVLADLRRDHLVAMTPMDVPTIDFIAECLSSRLREQDRLRLGTVINATGVVLHTNLGRAPLAREALDAIGQAAQGYSNLEYDLVKGARGSRGRSAERLLADLTGAEAALIVNNNAAAVLLTLSALAAGEEVIVSRGELLEIGGGFRIPDVVQQGGARLIEVGTTNKTRISDYESAITPSSRIILKVHPSNFRMEGFTAEAGLPELSALARSNGLALVYDLGSGSLLDMAPFGVRGEPVVRQSLCDGADIVTFSGDKLLGGPQAGVILGKSALIDRLRKHPLARALRIDKLCLAALEATLTLYQDSETRARRIPVLRMLSQTKEIVAARARRFIALMKPCEDADLEIVETTAFAGGGSLPGSGFASSAVAVSSECRAEDLANELRGENPALIGRIAEGRLLLDLFTVRDEELHSAAAALRAALERLHMGAAKPADRKSSP